VDQTVGLNEGVRGCADGGLRVTTCQHRIGRFAERCFVGQAMMGQRNGRGRASLELVAMHAVLADHIGIRQQRVLVVMRDRQPLAKDQGRNHQYMMKGSSAHPGRILRSFPRAASTRAASS
jgi:hypothetical protein